MEANIFQVCVECRTYNQAKYVKDTLDGFCMQKTSFPYVCVVMDDASTDGEQEVITKYLQSNFNLKDNEIVRNEETGNYSLTFAQHRANKNCFFAVFFLKYNHYRKRIRKEPYYYEWHNSAKYITMCEGDDYWTMPTKLQMQYDYLESHQDVMLSCHRYSILDVKTGKSEVAKNAYFDSKKHSTEHEFEFDINYNLNNWITKTLTNMYRRSAFKDDYYVGYKYARDVHFNYYVLKKGRGVCHSFNAGVYRMNVPTSVYGSLSRDEQLDINCKVYEELAEVTGDRAFRKMADKLIVLDCLRRLEPVGGVYYYALKFACLAHMFLRCLKRVCIHEESPISNKDKKS